MLHKLNDVETVVVLSGVKTDSHVSVKLDVEKLGEWPK